MENLKEKHICPVCGKECSPLNRSSKKSPVYKIFCSKECRYSEKGNKIVSEKNRQKCLNKYGVENISQLEEIKQKKSQTCLEHYGAENPMFVEELKEKMKTTLMNSYNVKNPAQCKEFKEKELITKRIKNYDYFISCIKLKGYEPLFDKDTYLTAREGDVLTFKCSCGEIFDFEVTKQGLTISSIYCPAQTHKYSSHYEQEVFDWLNSLDISNIERNKRKWFGVYGKEADLFLSDYNLVIEFHGLYWHSNLSRPDNYHYEKFNYFKEMNIDCIQIFENEWVNKREIVESIIKDRLYLNYTISENHCEISEISEIEFQNFLRENSIFGYKPSTYRIGLFIDDGFLIAVIGISKSRSKKYRWIVDSFCTKSGYSLNDFGYSTFLKSIKKNFEESILFSIDNRYFTGNILENNGFKYIGRTKPECFYFKRNTLNLMEKNDMKKIREHFKILNEESSLEENLMNNEYLWIYDAGKSNYFYGEEK